MKKRLLIVLFALVMLSLSVSLYSCSGDSSSGNGGGGGGNNNGNGGNYEGGNTYSSVVTEKSNVDLSEENDVTIDNDEDDVHYLVFFENDAEILRLAVRKGETYENLRPFFPTLDKKDGYVCWWDGDYTYTSYTKENQFKVYDEENMIIEIHSFSKKVN